MFELLITFSLLIVCYFTGRYVEFTHLKSIRRREGLPTLVPVLNVGKKPSSLEFRSGHLVTGSVVIGADYFKSVLGSLISLFGGRVAPLESVLDRARREATLRLQEHARGSDYIINVRYETSVLNTPKDKGKVPQVEVLAYGTAVTLKERPS